MSGRLLGPASRLVPRFRRSLQAKVVGTTLVASALVVALVGVLLVQQVGRGLLDAAVRQGVDLTADGLERAQNLLNDRDAADGSPTQAELTSLVEELSGSRALTSPSRSAASPPTAMPGQGAGLGLYGVVLIPERGGAYTDGLTRDDQVPQRLKAAVRESGQLSYTFTTTAAQVQPAGGPAVTGARPFLAVGGRLQAGTDQYQLFYLLPLDNAADTYGSVQRAVALAGIALVLLLVLIGYVLSRQVVAPVRQVAQGAERIAGGLLAERVPVTGEDELARLGVSFNAMATSLQAQIRQLEDLSRLQRRFVSDVSHELRTPLTTVRMAADLLHVQREDFPPATARAAELLQDELDRFERLLGDLLEISRFDAAAAVLEREPADVVQLARRSVETVQGLARQRGVAVDLRLVPDEPEVADVDSRRIDRILRNLLSNALEYGEGGSVEVAVAGSDAAVAVTVRDHGRGFDEAEVERLFDRFWRADPARKRNSGGTGLGLSIAAEDARLHDGTLDAWGSPGEGACFRLTLPRRVGTVVEESPLPLAPARVEISEPADVAPATAPSPPLDDVAEAAGAVAVAVEPPHPVGIDAAPDRAGDQAAEQGRDDTVDQPLTGDTSVVTSGSAARDDTW